MKKIVFDFNKIKSLPTFYKNFQKEFDLDSGLANNLDGLWDAVTGIISLPVKIEFIDLTLEQLDKFEKLITLFEDAEEELGDQFEFSYFMQNNEL